MIQLLLNNAVLLFALVFLYSASVVTAFGKRWYGNVLFGVVIGLIGILVIMSSVELFPGAILDTRTILISLAGAFFGLVPTLIAMAITITYRVILMGPGVYSGVLTIFTAGLIGLYWHYYRFKKANYHILSEFFIFGLLVTLVMILCMLVFPWPLAFEIIADISIPVLAIYPVTTMALAYIINDQLTRVEAKEVLSKSEQHFRETFEQAGLGIAHVDVNNNFIKINQTMRELFGYSQVDLMRININKLLYSYENEAFFQALEQLKHKAIPRVKEELTVLNKQGKMLVLSITATLVHSTNEEPSYVVMFIEDITNQKAIERELIELTRFNETVIQSANEGIVVVDLNMRYVRWNAFMEHYVGIKEIDIIGQPVEEAMPFLKRIGVVDKFRHVMRHDITESLEFDFFSVAHNERKWCMNTISPLKNQEGDIKGVITIVRDLTDFKQAEKARMEQLQFTSQVIKSAKEGIVIYDLNLRYQTWNPFLEELTGLKAEEVIGKHVLELEPSAEKYAFEAELQRIIDTHETFQFEFEYDIKRTGKKGWTGETFSPLYDSVGNVTGIIGIVHDITQNKRHEQEMRFISERDQLTGLYNRNYFEQHMTALDQKAQPYTIIMGDVNGLKLVNDGFGHQAGDKLLMNVSTVLLEAAGTLGTVCRIGGDEFCLVLKTRDQKKVENVISHLYALMEINQSSQMEFAPSISLGYAFKDEKHKTYDQVMKVAEEAMYRHKLLDRKSIRHGLITSIRSALFEKSRESVEHADRIIELMLAFGKALDLSQEELDDVQLLGSLHDIGKMGIDQAILDKEEPLSEDDWREIKKHPEIGYRIAQSSPELTRIGDYILTHHESYDGTGYPQGLKGEEIPLLSRMLAIVDTYDVMTNDRPYRKALPKDKVIQELIDKAGSQFDPELVTLFVSLVK